jgi:hypothetical protein
LDFSNLDDVFGDIFEKNKINGKKLLTLNKENVQKFNIICEEKLLNRLLFEIEKLKIHENSFL